VLVHVLFQGEYALNVPALCLHFKLFTFFSDTVEHITDMSLHIQFCLNSMCWSNIWEPKADCISANILMCFILQVINFMGM
jgi:hypothetical protein